MKNFNKIIKIKTKKQFEIIDLTDKIKEFFNNNNIKNGLLNVQSFHTTATVFIQENEPLLLEDIKRFLEKTVPQKIRYQHDNFKKRTVNLCDNECTNGHSHCKSLIFPTSLTVSIINNKIQLGRWQRILFIELDRSRPRKVQVQIIGE